MSRSSLILVVLLNLVLTSLVVAGAMVLFPPEEGSPAPSAESAGLDSALHRIAALEEGRKRDRVKALELEDEIAQLRGALRAVPAAGGTVEPEPPEAEPVAGAEPEKELSPEEKLMKGFGEMIKQRARQQRDRFIEDLLNPTERSAERQERMITRIADDVARRLELDEGYKTEVERILRQVDENRRQKFRDLILSKPSPDDVTYEEVKEVLDDSFEEEDELVRQSLPAEKSKEYVETATPFRQFFYIGAQTAFSSESESGR